ncbi:MAG: SPOR domain-containing protein [Candidatus Accumulibacter meliphilus]|jgi:hypothetical protein|uniref:SPOR domain-containing protein n=1 Tax=Candidatus Accumulibacter meliphilus TaxID=2211374 RepID=A0A369XMI2_9PROT|nr:MAG: SPOR domain-containing protein [Candidatus Accumulibacter meliphilus]
MRITVFLLLLANLLLFVWTQGYLGASVNPDARHLAQQLLPERVRIVSRGEPPPTAKKKTEAEKVVEKVVASAADNEGDKKPVEKPVESCQLWSKLAAGDAEQVERLLTERFTAFKGQRRNVGEITGYWVFIPPLANREEAVRKVAELQELGVTDYFIVPSSGSRPLAVSLGAYRGEEAARARLEALRAKGVRSARIGERRSEPTLSTLEIHGPEADMGALREAIVALLPKAEAAPCSAPAEVTP